MLDIHPYPDGMPRDPSDLRRAATDTTWHLTVMSPMGEIYGRECDPRDRKEVFDFAQEMVEDGGAVEILRVTRNLITRGAVAVTDETALFYAERGFEIVRTSACDDCRQSACICDDARDIMVQEAAQ